MIRRLHADEKGITPVLGAALVIGAIITAASAFLAVWVPNEMNRREREHMLEVEGSFRELRAKIEGLEVGESRSVYVKMSPEPVPLVPNPRTSGALSVLPSAGENYGVVKFTLGDQSLVYESGMVLLVQDNVNLMKSAPHVVTVGEVGDKLEVHFDIIKVCGLNNLVSGTGTSTIIVSVYQENLLENGELKENVVIQINENTGYRRAWGEYLEERYDEFEEKGYYLGDSSEIENLQLTILGKVGESGTYDIIFYEKVTEIWVSIS